MDEEEKRPNEERKHLEKQLQLLSEMSGKDSVSVDEICRLTGAMIALYGVLRNIMYD